MKYIAFIILSVFLIACKQEQTANAEQETAEVLNENELKLSAAQLKTIAVTTDTLTQKQIAGTLTLSGKVTINPNDKVSLSSALGGRVARVNVLSGAYVAKGTPILTLEDNQFIQLQQDYLTAKAQLLSAEPNYIRQKELNSNKSASDKVLQQAEAEYRALLALKSGLEEKLRLIHINPATLTPTTIQRSISVFAPFNGWVSGVFVNKGRYVSPSDVLVELINPQGLLLNIKVFEKDLPSIKIGQTLYAYTNNNPNQKATAKVISKGSRINDDGTSEIIAQITNSQAVELMEGLYVNAVITVENMTVYTLPADAIVSFEGKNYVFEQADPGTFRLTAVETGNSFENATEIKNPERLANKKIVSKEAYTLLMALKNSAEEE